MFIILLDHVKIYLVIILKLLQSCKLIKSQKITLYSFNHINKGYHTKKVNLFSV